MTFIKFQILQTEFQMLMTPTSTSPPVLVKFETFPAETGCPVSHDHAVKLTRPLLAAVHQLWRGTNTHLNLLFVIHSLNILHRVLSLNEHAFTLSETLHKSKMPFRQYDIIF